MRIAGAQGRPRRRLVRGAAGRWGCAVCLRARVAVRVLMQLATFDAPDGAERCTPARAPSRWRDWLTDQSTLSVPRQRPRHADADALRFRGAEGQGRGRRRASRRVRRAARRRHEVARRRHRRCTSRRGRAGLFLDLAGEALHRRGYRVAMVDAPLKETLAAAVLALGGARAELPFVDPMAGSGTLAIEHALAARGIAPGLRRRFGFERWPTLPPEALADWGGCAPRPRRRRSPPSARRCRRSSAPTSTAAAVAAARQNAAAAERRRRAHVRARRRRGAARRAGPSAHAASPTRPTASA